MRVGGRTAGSCSFQKRVEQKSISFFQEGKLIRNREHGFKKLLSIEA